MPARVKGVGTEPGAVGERGQRERRSEAEVKRRGRVAVASGLAAPFLCRRPPLLLVDAAVRGPRVLPNPVLHRSEGHP